MSGRDDVSTFRGAQNLLSRFVSERDWDKFHTPRNLTLALMGEVGELAELFQVGGASFLHLLFSAVNWDAKCSSSSQWRGEGEDIELRGFTGEEKERVSEELADVLAYVLRLGEKCDVDLPVALERKMAKNAAKYPAHLVRGSSAKYTAYQSGEAGESAQPPQDSLPAREWADGEEGHR